MKPRRRPDIVLWAAIAVSAFLYVPIAMVVLFSFTSNPTTSFPIREFSVQGYTGLFDDPVIVSGLWASVYVGIGSTVLATLLGVPAAIGLTGWASKSGGLIRAVIAVPIAVPTLILSVAMLSFLSFTTVPLSLNTVILAHTMYSAAFIVFIVSARLQDLDPLFVQASRDLGASPWRSFRDITFPLIRSAIVGAMILAFAVSFDEFVLALFTIGPQSTLPLVIWSMLKRGTGNPAALGALSTMLLALTAILLLVTSRFTRLSVEKL